MWHSSHTYTKIPSVCCHSPSSARRRDDLRTLYLMKSCVCHQRCRHETHFHLSSLFLTKNERNERLYVRLYQSRPQNIGGATSLVHLAWESHGPPTPSHHSVSIPLWCVTFVAVVALFQVNGRRWFTDFIINCWVLWFRRPLQTSGKWICWAQRDSGAKSCISLLLAWVFQWISKSEAVTRPLVRGYFWWACATCDLDRKEAFKMFASVTDGLRS